MGTPLYLKLATHPLLAARMTLPPDSEISSRDAFARCGAAHLAWGVALFLALLYVAQHWPVESNAWLEALALALYAAGLLWVLLGGWLSVERGWNLRQPQPAGPARTNTEQVCDLLLALATAFALARGGQSRLLTAGLDRLVATILTVAVVSLVMALTSRRLLQGAPPGDTTLASRVRIGLGMVLLVLVVAAELLPL
jgi:hypothetical protein